MRRCVCGDQKSLRFTLYFGFDYVVVLGGMVAANTGNGHDIFMIFLSLKFIFYGKILFVF